MLVACQTVNRATWAKAQAVLAALRTRWPGPSDLALADIRDLRDVLRPIGLQNSRAMSVWRFALAWREAGAPETREDVLSMPGCGPYAADSWEIFVRGRRDINPTDGRLRFYLGLEGGRDGKRQR